MAGTHALLFDMDGVLVDVSRSFRAVIAQVVHEIGGREIAAGEIQELKQRGGFNDDVKICVELVSRRLGRADEGAIRRLFDVLYQGLDGRTGAWERETWLVPRPMLQRLARGRRLGVVTGRTAAEVALARRLAGDAWDLLEHVVTQDDLPPGRGKPAPDGILMAMRALGAERGVYVGDSIDDVRAARAAGLDAVGVLPPGVGAGEELRGLMLAAGARIVLCRIADIEDHLEPL